MPTSLQLIAQQNRARSSSGFAAALAAASAVPAVKKWTPPKAVGGTSSSNTSNHDQTFWGWLGDIVSRPERAVLGGLNGLENQTAANIQKSRQEKAAGNGFNLGEAVGDEVAKAGAGIGGATRGFFSTNKADQYDGAKTIRNLTGDFNKVAGNKDTTGKGVPDVVAGVGGFGLDLVADPLSYIGIGALTKGAKIVGAAAKAGDAAGAFKAGGKAIADYTGLSDAVKLGKGGAGLAKKIIKPTVVAPEAVATADTAGIAGRVAESKVAATGPGGALTGPAAGVSRAVHARAMKVLPDFLKSQLDTSRYSAAMKSGAVATELGGAGLAKDPNRLNQFAAMTMMKHILKPARQAASDLGLNGLPRAQAIGDQAYKTAQAAEAVLDSKGAAYSVAMPDGTHVPLGMSQVMGVIRKNSPASKQALDLMLGNASTEVPMTKLMEAAGHVAQNLPDSDASAAAALLSTDKGIRTAGGAMKNYLAEPADVKVIGAKGTSRGEIYAALLDGLTSEKSRAALVKITQQNVAAARARGMSESYELSEEAKGAIAELASDPSSTGDAIVAINRAPDQIAARANDSDALPASGNVAGAKVADDLETEHPGVAAATSAAEEVGKRLTAGDAQGAVEAASKGARKAADDVTDPNGVFTQTEEADPSILEATGEPEDAVRVESKLSREAYQGATNAVIRALDPVGQLFRWNRGMEGTGIYHAVTASGQAVHIATTEISTRLNRLARMTAAAPEVAPGRTILHEAIDAYRSGQPSQNPLVASLAPDLEPMLQRLMPVGDDTNALLNGVLSRVGTPVEWLAARLEHDPLHQMAIDTDQIRDLPTAYASMLEQLSQAKDPIEATSALSKTMLRAASESSVQAQAEQHLIRAGMAAHGPAKGMMKAVFDKGAHMGAFASPDLRLTAQGANALSAMHGLLAPGKAGAFEQFMRNTFDPFQQLFKFGVTLPNPGHHIRNMLGNFIMTFLAEGPRGAVQAHRDMWKVLAAHNSYDGFDAMKALQQFGQTEDIKYAGQSEIMFNPKIAGKNTPITNERFYDEMRNRGLLPDFVSSGMADLQTADALGEDVSGTSAAARAANALTRKGPAGLLGKVSQANDHAGKIFHAAQMLRKYEKDGYVAGRLGEKIVPKDTDALWTAIADRVRQYQPDSSTLTKFEKQGMRRIMPFYSWMRGAIIAVAESALVHPGRVLAFPKASYNLAVATGVNPDSLADPFPEDQLFPSYLREEPTGPQLKIGGSYWAIDPNGALNPTMGIANMFPNGANPTNGGASGVVKMLSPFIKTPLEVNSSTHIDTGAPITDWGAYLDGQLGFANTLASTAGISITNSVLNGKPTPLSNITKGNTDNNQQLVKGLLSMAGVPVLNESQPNFIKSAQYQQQGKN